MIIIRRYISLVEDEHLLIRASSFMCVFFVDELGIDGFLFFYLILEKFHVFEESLTFSPPSFFEFFIVGYFFL